MKATFHSITPMIPTCGSLAESLSFYAEHMGFSILWQGDGMAGIERDGVSLNLVVNDNQNWADNASFSIGVSDLDSLYNEYQAIPARVGPLELKPWGRLEFHLIAPSGVCFQFYQRAAA
ncbi:MAG: hypothetical protein NTY98_09235 [Verrucomicrobia bacterium]|nr:hypothetical protein [Verrucomicrobiota bacterium]